MIYRLINDYINAIGEIAKGRLDSRNYFIPYSTRKVADKTDKYSERENSDRVRILSGEWDFLCVDDGMLTEIDTDNCGFSKTTVPHSWQSDGIETFEYLENFPFKIKENVPFGRKSNNKVVVYRRFFEISDTSITYVLSFIRVAGAFDVYINGKQVGFSKISHADFDITDKITVGTNEIVVVVHKWSDADLVTMSENFCINGITGDVLLYMHDKSGVINYEISVSKEGETYIAHLDVLTASPAEKIIFSMENGEDTIVEIEKTPESEIVAFDFQGEYTSYSSEEPFLYDIYITIADKDGLVLECVKGRLGFKSCGIVGEAFSYNEQPIKINGINYSCIYNKEGKLLTKDDYYKDLIMIKKYNINAVQFTVDVDPLVYEICAEIGLYIIKKSKVNLDFIRKNKKCKFIYKTEKFGKLIKNIAIADYTKTANNSAFIMYNFARENSFSCIKETVDYLAASSGIIVYNDFSCAVRPVFNPSVETAIDEANSDSRQVIFFSEFASNNGIGCATLTEYNDLVKSVPKCMGGCIDEFCDRYILGKGYNDCGMVTMDRRPYSGAENIKYVYRPFSAKLISNNKIEIFNNYNFRDSDDIDFYLVVVKNGQQLSRTQLNAYIKAKESKIFDITLGHIDGDMYLDVIAVDRLTLEYVSYEQLPISYELTAFDCGQGEKLYYKDYNNNLFIKFDGGEAIFSREIGTFVSYKIMGKELLKADAVRLGGNCFNTNIYRPFVRNLYYSPYYTQICQSIVYKDIKGESDELTTLEINVEVILRLKKKDAFLVQDMYKINANGVIDVFSVITPLTRHLPNLDCFGKQLKLMNAYGNVTYYGRGPLDNYIDMYQYAPMGLYKSSIDTVAEDYAIAQESGNHTNVHFVTLTDNHNNGIMIIARKNPFQLRVKPYNDEEIMRCFKERSNDYQQTGIYVDINAFVSGIGKTENGLPISKYLVRPSEYVVQFSVVPLYNEDYFEGISKL